MDNMPLGKEVKRIQRGVTSIERSISFSSKAAEEKRPFPDGRWWLLR